MTENKEVDAGLVISDRKVAYWHFLIRDPLAFISLLWIILTLVAAFIGPELLGNEAVKMNLKARNTAPGSLGTVGWEF